MTTTIDELPSTALPGEPQKVGEPGPSWEDLRALERRLQQQSGRRDGWMFSILVFSAIALVFSAIGMGTASPGPSKRTAAATVPAVTTTLPPAPAPSPDPVLVLDFRVLPGPTTIGPGQVDLRITNGGRVQHELLVFRSDLPPSAYPTNDGDIVEDGPGVSLISDGDNIDPGDIQTRTVDLTQPGTYLFVCNLHGHFKAGMYSEVTVK
jgi:hypothetical protein